MKKAGFILIFLLLAFFFSSVDILGLALTPEGYFYYHPDTDVNVYYTYMDQAREGRFLFCNQFSAEPHPCKLFFPLWYAGGVIGSVFHLTNFVSFLVIRFLTLLLSAYIFWKLCLYLFKEAALPAFLSAFFSGGLILFYYTNFFAIAFHNPLHLLVVSLMILLLWLSMIIWLKESRWYYWVALFALSLSISMMHAYEAIILFINYAVLLIFGGWLGRKNFKKSLFIFLLVALGAGLGSGYYLVLFIKYQAYHDWFLFNYLPLYGPKSLILNYGLLLPLSLLAVYWLFKEKQKLKPWLVIISWFIGGLTSLFLPLYFNNKLLFSWYIALALLSAYALIYFYRQGYFLRYKKIILILAIILLVSGNLYFYGRTIYRIYFIGYPWHLEKNYLKPLLWLKENSSLDEAVVASYKWETFLSAYAGAKSLAGSNQSNNEENKKAFIRYLFADNFNDDLKRHQLIDYNVEYLLYTYLEKEMGSFNPDEKNYLREIYNDGWAKIYQVIW